MSNRKVYHVVPRSEGGWEVELEGTREGISHHHTKEEAIEHGRSLAKAETLSQLITHKQDGTFQTEYTYGDDPNPPAG